MKYVLDASVAIAALRSSEPSHAAALRTCMAFFAGRDEVVVPAIFDVEIVSALVRRGADPKTVASLFDRHFTTRTAVPIGPRVLRIVRGIASATKVRAADAFYVWVATREGLPLVTLDREVIARAPLVGVNACAELVRR